LAFFLHFVIDHFFVFSACKMFWLLLVAGKLVGETSSKGLYNSSLFCIVTVNRSSKTHF